MDIPDQIAMLSDERGLIIDDYNEAKRQLQIISYFCLAGYLRPMESDKITHRFKPNSHFDNAVDLYYFDKEFRALLFTAIQSIEVAVRASIIRRVSLQYGAFWFMEASHFSNNAIYQTCLAKMREEIVRSKEDFIQEHFSRYDNPAMPPVWKALEITSFGTLSKIYCNLNDKGLKRRIAQDMGLPQHIYFESWLKSIASIRNNCAHHNRVWNRLFPIMPKMPAKLPSAWIEIMPANQRKIYSILCILAYLEKVIHPQSTFVGRLKTLLSQHPNVDVSAMGFPVNWETEFLWK